MSEAKQDLSELSDYLLELKAVGVGTRLENTQTALERVQEDIDKFPGTGWGFVWYAFQTTLYAAVLYAVVLGCLGFFAVMQGSAYKLTTWILLGGFFSMALSSCWEAYNNFADNVKGLHLLNQEEDLREQLADVLQEQSEVNKELNERLKENYKDEYNY